MEQNQLLRDDEIEIDLREVASVLMAKAGIIILSGILLALLAIIGTKFLVTPQYQSVTKMYVLNKQNNDTLTNSDLQSSSLLAKDYAELIKSRTVTEAVIAKLQLPLTHEGLLGKVTVNTKSDTRVITISVLDPDPYRARDIANEIRNMSAEHIKKVMNIEAVNVVDEANVPSGKYSPSIRKNGMLAGMFGCFLAIVIILVQYISNDTIKTSEDVERYLQLSTLGSIPLAADDKDTKKKKIKKYKRG